MSQLIAMRQRIRAIETIQKITHAMQLISMSAHSRLRHKKVFIEQYKDAIARVWCNVHVCVSPNVTHTIFTRLNPPTDISNRSLIIVIGSQKGLVGNFNTNIVRFFEKEHGSLTSTTHLITIGKQITQYFAHRGIAPYHIYNELNAQNFVTIATALTSLILTGPEIYTTVTVYANVQKSFFVQQQQIISLIPYAEQAQTAPKCKTDCTSEYLWAQRPEEILAFISSLSINAKLVDILFNSLLAEQAARFIFMDNSTRSAQNLLNQMKLDYNKRRQAKITLELTDLTASMTQS